MEKKEEVSKIAQELFKDKKYYEYTQHIKSLCKRKISSNNLQAYTKLFNIAIDELNAAGQVFLSLTIG